jgi:3-(3-hydroxy-phenyl)propionate hydroxylase
MLGERYLGDAVSAVHLIRPDQHVAARWSRFDAGAMRTALRKACAKD